MSLASTFNNGSLGCVLGIHDFSHSTPAPMQIFNKMSRQKRLRFKYHLYQKIYRCACGKIAMRKCMSNHIGVTIFYELDTFNRVYFQMGITADKLSWYNYPLYCTYSHDDSIYPSILFLTFHPTTTKEDIRKLRYSHLSSTSANACASYKYIAVGKLTTAESLQLQCYTDAAIQKFNNTNLEHTIQHYLHGIGK